MEFLNKKIVSSVVLLIVMTVTYLGVKAQADIVVVGSPGMPSLDKRAIKRIFLKKTASYGDGITVTPFDLPDENDVKWRFYKSVMGKKPAQLNSYWSRVLFTGSGEPPQVLNSEQSLINKVNTGSGLIGYIDAANVKPGMNILYRVSEP